MRARQTDRHRAREGERERRLRIRTRINKVLIHAGSKIKNARKRESRSAKQQTDN